jgi:hypothetical protein
VPIISSGDVCARRDCQAPVWSDRLCARCWRLARFIGKDPGMFVYEPLNGYRDERDAVELPWDAWGEEARTRGGSVADMFAESSRTAGPGRFTRRPG